MVKTTSSKKAESGATNEPAHKTTPNSSVPPGAGSAAIPTPHKARIVVSLMRITAGLICVAIIVAGGWYIHGRNDHSSRPASKTAVAAAKPKPKAAIKQPAVPAQFKTADATYLGTAKLVGDQKIFADTSSLGQTCDGSNCRATASSDILYYQIGTTDTGSIILYITTPACNPSGCFQEFALEKSGGYSILLATADSGTEADVASDARQYAKTFTPNVTLDTTTKLAGLDFPATISVKGQTYDRRYSSPYGSFMKNGLSDIRSTVYGPGLTSAQPVVLGNAGANLTAYKLVTKDDTTFQVVENYATLGNLFTMPYDLPNPLQASNDKPVDVSWQSGSSTQVNLVPPPTSACGAAGYTLVKVPDVSQLAAVGTSVSGQVLYQLPADNAFSQKVFTEDYDGGSSADGSSLQGLTEQQFMNAHGYVLFKNSLGEYILLVRSDMITGGGCAKPVIYLYPQHAAEVSVKVDADVVKSAPLYPASNGWQNVLAEPSGTLSYQGKTYDSLYWEGRGFGAYPDITSGTVVKSGQAVATIQSQLKKQGLNSKEISDFLTYWQPKLPTTPYVRLTWLNTAQMNTLAPLNISPRPQTLIRVFLDFEGLQKPEKLPAQQLVTPLRQGFTVVEWGGLARNGLQG